ncbi:MAG: hypothetical protein ND895_15970 [Pyrinomonadaceae bacterium]|nr:hypothetical protein [Pyrinomonadaceae bacterium]
MESVNEDLYRLLLDVLTQLPSLLTMLICIVVAIVRWKRHPRASLIVIIALAFLSLGSLAFAAVFVWVPRWVVSVGNPASAQSVFVVLGTIYNVLFAVAMAVLLLAVFIQRPSSQRQQVES